MGGPSRPIRIGILAPEFLINIGANDFLKNILRGLALDPRNELVFLCPRSNERIEHLAPPAVKNALRQFPFVKKALRSTARRLAPATDRLVRRDAGAYAFYAEACPRMEFITSDTDGPTLERLRVDKGIDVFLPSIHVLPPTLPYVTYWPDCQPKHYPEFFDDAAQQARDERILGLLGSGKPMIINSRDAKNDMARFYRANRDQVFELPFAPIIEVDKLIPRPELLLPYELPRRYFLVCNQFWVHKSIETTIEAAALAKRRGLDVAMVFTGRMQEPRKPGYIDGLRRMVTDLGAQDVVRFLDYIPKDDQLEIMKHAIAVVQPTLFEGGPGGGAVYDAVSLGIRAIVSDIPVNHELPVDPERLVLFRTKDATDLVDKMERFLDARYEPPSAEDLYQRSRSATQALSARLYQAIGRALGEA